uniref:Uncharacterized protein n=1 Tax=Arundo donax TaxID=35708 RepID=A0A0A9A9D0_ARUDO
MLELVKRGLFLSHFLFFVLICILSYVLWL